MRNGALLQVIQNLVACQPVRAGDRQNAFQVRHIKIADPPGADLSFFMQLLKSGHGILQGMFARPVE
jgi:hypothetical protein